MNWLKVTKTNVNPSRPTVHSKRCIKITIKLSFYFHIFCGASQGFMKFFKALIKHFKAAQRSVKMKIYVNFLSASASAFVCVGTMNFTLALELELFSF